MWKTTTSSKPRVAEQAELAHIQIILSAFLKSPFSSIMSMKNLVGFLQQQKQP